MAVRRLRKNWRPFPLAVLSLSIGIAVNVALFSVVSQLYLRDLPIDDPDRVVRIFSLEPSGQRHRVTLEEAGDVEAAATALHEVSA